jgi:hypothetical protein
MTELYYYEGLWWYATPQGEMCCPPFVREWEDVEKYFNELLVQVNETFPTTHRIAKLTVRKEDFKRTGTLKVSRN